MQSLSESGREAGGRGREISRKRVKSWKSLSYAWLCDPMDCSPPGSSVHRILQARRLEWVAVPFSRGSSWPNPDLLHCRQILYCQSHQGSPQNYLLQNAFKKKIFCPSHMACGTLVPWPGTEPKPPSSIRDDLGLLEVQAWSSTSFYVLKSPVRADFVLKGSGNLKQGHLN